MLKVIWTTERIIETSVYFMEKFCKMRIMLVASVPNVKFKCHNEGLLVLIVLKVKLLEFSTCWFTHRIINSSFQHIVHHLSNRFFREWYLDIEDLIDPIGLNLEKYSKFVHKTVTLGEWILFSAQMDTFISRYITWTFYIQIPFWTPLLTLKVIFKNIKDE